ncbi:hypothetical protein ACRRTK_023300 [Alexandromys fortis]
MRFFPYWFATVGLTSSLSSWLTEKKRCPAVLWAVVCMVTGQCGRIYSMPFWELLVP